MYLVSKAVLLTSGALKLCSVLFQYAALSKSVTSEPNELVKPFHHRMPVVVPDGYEEQWTEQVKDADELKGLLPIMMGWSPDGWVLEDLKKKETEQKSLF